MWKLPICVTITLFICVLTGGHNLTYGRNDQTPLQFLKAREAEHKGEKGEVYLGKVLTLTYPAYGFTADKVYHPFLLELTDVLKTPLRSHYRLVLRGYSDRSGAAETNIILSKKRAENLRHLLIQKYYMKGERITAEGYGDANPVASNETVEGRRRNRRVEIHVYGDVTEAVRFIH